MNLAYSLERNAFMKPDAIAVIFKNKEFTYGDINVEVNKLANQLTDLGVRRGDRVCIWLPNGMEFIYAFYAVLKIGAMAVPMNHLFKEAESFYILENSGSKVVITSEEKQGIVEQIYPRLPELETMIVVGDHVTTGTFDSRQLKIIPYNEFVDKADNRYFAQELSPDHGACILYTSGTTGNPKGVELTHYNLSTNAEFYAECIGLTDRHYGCIVTPLSHLLVLMAGLILIFLKGGKFYLFEKFSTKKVAATIREQNINFFIGVPAMYYMFLMLPEEEKYDMSCLEICITSGAQMPLEVRKRFEDRFQTVTLQAYGQTEFSGNYR